VAGRAGVETESEAGTETATVDNDLGNEDDSKITIDGYDETV
jgi:hypothetical protein